MLFAPQHTYKIYSWGQIIREIAAKDLSTFDCHLHVVRHAETAFNAQDLISGQTETHLTELGMWQSRLLQSQLCANYDLYCCSTLSRARETLSIVYPDTKARRRKVLFDPRLNEISLGSLEGLKRRFIPEYANGDIDYAPQGGETYRELTQRVVSFVLDIIQILDQKNKTTGTNIVFFTHTGVIRVLRCFFEPIDKTQELFINSFSNAALLKFNLRDLHVPSFLRSP